MGEGAQPSEVLVGFTMDEGDNVFNAIDSLHIAVLEVYCASPEYSSSVGSGS